MSSDDKLVKKILSRRSITVDDCDKLLTNYGYERHKSGGSHRVYHQQGTKSITVVTPKHSKYVNTAYVDLVIKALSLEG
jgi:predicted RNA binding protein YcfA (HicA-like mRNA interferase family)